MTYISDLTKKIEKTWPKFKKNLKEVMLIGKKPYSPCQIDCELHMNQLIYNVYKLMELVKLAYPDFDNPTRATLATDYLVHGLHSDMQIALKSMKNLQIVVSIPSLKKQHASNSLGLDHYFKAAIYLMLLMSTNLQRQ